MWICKIRPSAKDTVIGGLCNSCGVSGTGYPVCSKKKGNYTYVNFALFICGSERNKKIFFEKLRKNPRIINLEIMGNHALGEIKEASSNISLYNHNVFHIEPVKADENGYETWTIAAWEKQDIINFIDGLKDTDARILKLYEKNISNLSILTLYPELTINQQKAFELAVKNKYYDIPRGIRLEELAALMGISYSTYQSHLRKAERKMLPFFFENNQRYIS